MTIYWSGLSSFHFQLSSSDGREDRRKGVVWSFVFQTELKAIWCHPCDISFNDVCLAIFEVKYLIIITTIFIYIYIISVVCYGTVKLWLWDKASCRASFSGFVYVRTSSTSWVLLSHRYVQVSNGHMWFMQMQFRKKFLYLCAECCSHMRDVCHFWAPMHQL